MFVTVRDALCLAVRRHRDNYMLRAMAKPKDLSAVDVHSEDVGDYNVTEPGWYAVDDAGKVVLGPFTSLAECERAMRDRKRMGT